MNRRGAAVALLALTALLWSSGGLCIKLIDLGPMAITGARSALAAAVLVLALRLSRGRDGEGRARFRFSRAELCGAVAYAGLLVSNVAATKLTTAANAILLAYTAPVYVALLAPRLLGEPTRRGDWLFVLATLAGMVLFFLDRLSPGGLTGNLLAVGTGLSYAAFTLSLRSQKEASPLRSILLGHLLTAAAGLPFLAADLARGPWPGAASLLGLLYLGVAQQGVSLLLYAWCIRRLCALEAILVMTLEPILNPVWVAVGYGERPGPWALAGGAVVLCAVTLRGAAAARPARGRGTAAEEAVQSA
ncbi:protein of unknown function DUF6 transmembrane [Desulfovibrio sp. X2]|uniref:DMT family transporter n=1 Tax=Desulfovibrio sp. X2 TaxID=941449 RepID=UPI000358BF4B|nr:DMT family transporter [Desulfovibrio sp. X2]EPR39802.1 protein of unknown function DUF6 transmembrane [Desulfovibrio sp. X2]